MACAGRVAAPPPVPVSKSRGCRRDPSQRPPGPSRTIGGGGVNPDDPGESDARRHRHRLEVFPYEFLSNALISAWVHRNGEASGVCKKSVWVENLEPPSVSPRRVRLVVSRFFLHGFSPQNRRSHNDVVSGSCWLANMLVETDHYSIDLAYFRQVGMHRTLLFRPAASTYHIRVDDDLRSRFPHNCPGLHGKCGRLFSFGLPGRGKSPGSFPSLPCDAAIKADGG